MQKPSKPEPVADSSDSAVKSEGQEVYGNIVLQVVAKIKNEPFLFVIAVVSLLIGLTMLSAKLGSPDLRFIVVVVALLAFAVILGYYILAGLQVRAVGKEHAAPGLARSPNGASIQSQTAAGSIDAMRESSRPERVINEPKTQHLATGDYPMGEQHFDSPVQPTAPPIFSAKGRSRLNELLAEIYDTQSKSRRVVDGAGMNAKHIEFKDNAIDNWHNILVEARKRGKVEAILEFVCEEYPERAGELKVLGETSPR